MNKIKCLKCNEILESTHRHDFQQCNCENETFVDGGNDYCRIGGGDIYAISFWNEKKQEWKKHEKSKKEEVINPEQTFSQELKNLIDKYNYINENDMEKRDIILLKNIKNSLSNFEKIIDPLIK